jgi:hypothetical protein
MLDDKVEIQPPESSKNCLWQKKCNDGISGGIKVHTKNIVPNNTVEVEEKLVQNESIGNKLSMVVTEERINEKIND